MKSFLATLVVVLMCGLAGCDQNLGLPLADASATTIRPVLYPAPAADADEGPVFEYH